MKLERGFAECRLYRGDPACVRWQTRNEGEIYYLDLEVSYPQPTSPETVELGFTVDERDIYSSFAPLMGGDRFIGPDWERRVSASRLACGIPLYALLSRTGENRATLTLSDPRVPAEIACGLEEERGVITFRVSLFTMPVSALTHYAVTLRLDRRPVSHETAVREAVAAMETAGGYRPAPVPAQARLPMDSTWYSYHQMLDPKELVEECRLAKQLGMETLILDDGWQTEDNTRGYAYCGDWQVASRKIPDMRAFISQVHDAGMKAMMWFSVPFVGRYSANHARFHGMYLDPNTERPWNKLDPRFPEVRRFLVELYTHAVEEFDLDGVKLDFIDSIVLEPDSMPPDPRRDTESVEEGTERLLTEVYRALLACRPDIMIEYRQRYIGPVVRSCGNILRVTDCPADPLRNRAAILDLRLTSGQTAIHSDMLMWRMDETVEDAATEVIATLFATPQISVRLLSLPQEHVQMLAFYLGIVREWQPVLQFGELQVRDSATLYSSATARADGRAVTVLYDDPVGVVTEGEREHLVVNGTGRTCLYIDTALPGLVTVTDCMGTVVSRQHVGAGATRLTVPKSGTYTYTRAAL